MIISFRKMIIYVMLASKQLIVCRSSSKRDRLNNARQMSSLSMDYDGLPVHEIYDEYPAFDFYNDKCKSSCGVTATMSNRLIMNSCPKCMQEYAHEHCNMCCSGGVSSLKLLWHGCGGIFSFQSNVSEEPLVYDGTTTVTKPQSKIKFTPCECYEKIITLKGEAINCEVNDTIVLEEDREMCIVSVTSDNIVNLRQPLPNPLIIVQNDFVDDAESNFPLTTFFDTSCVANQGKDVLPTYPGYGKFPNTVQDEGLIIIEHSSKERLQLPKALKYFQGLPSTDLFWFEFIDGTSKSFWPKKTQQAASFFDPSFASCSCLKCDSSPPSLKPSTLPYSPSPSKSPSGFEPPDPVKGCAGKYQICDKYSKENCKTTTSGPTWNIGQKCDFSLVVNATTALNYEKSNVQSLNQEESNRRKLHALKGLVDSIESGNISVSGASLFGNLLTQDFLENQITFHLKTKNLLKAQLVTIKGH